MKTNPLPSQEYLKECFNYDPATGVLVWRKRPPAHFMGTKQYSGERICIAFNNQFAGTIAGRKHYYRDGRPHSIIVKINKKATYAHRIIYVMMIGPIPDGVGIDHKNTNPFDNAWSNLRLATQFQNLSNQRLRRNKKSNLPKGVVKSWNRFVGQIVYHNKHIYLGRFDTAQEAHAAYCAKALELKGEFARFQ